MNTPSIAAGGQGSERPAQSTSCATRQAKARAVVHAGDVVGATKITRVFSALGGAEPKHGRARAFWRDGDNPQAISLNDEKGCWFDHRDGVGGGVLDLVILVRGGTRSDALHWLSSLSGVALADRPLTVAERRQFARAKHEAHGLVEWKQSTMDVLKRERARWWDRYHASLRCVLTTGLDSPEGEIAALLHEFSEAEIDRLNHEINMLAESGYADLLPIYRRTAI